MSKQIEVQKNSPVTRPEPFRTLDNFDRFVDRMFSDSFSPMFNHSWLAPQSKSEIRETNDAYVLSAEIPGIPSENVDVEINGNMLTIRAEKEEEKNSDRSHRSSYQSYQHTFTLPSTVDAERIEAHCDNGMLEVLLPKMETAMAKKISVQSGKGSIWSRLTGRKDESKDVMKN